ncbi:MAG: MFS transporter [Thermomicrobiales bacterium]|nr:MFS transporter [Thermomicrobiales bacterium]
MSGSSPTNPGSSAERTVLVTAALGTMLAPLNSTMIVVALPDILDRFDRSLAWGSWIVLSYLVAMASVQPLGGSLGDRYGRRRLFLIGLTGFFVATVVAALAWRIEVLILARTVQAITGAIVIPNGTALVRAHISPSRQGRAFGTIGAWIAVAAGLGPPIGGLVTDSLGWRWIFAANVLLIGPALALGLRLPAEGLRQAGRFDLRGALGLMISLVSLALALTIWKVTTIAVAAAFAIIGIGAGWWLLRHVRQTEQPVLNVRLFRRPGYAPATLAVMLSNLAMYTLLLSLPVFLTSDVGWSSSRVGFLLAGMSLQMVIFSPFGGTLSDRVGRRTPALIGTILLVAGVAPFVAISIGWHWYMLLLPSS